VFRLKAATEEASSRAITPLPVQPSTNTIDSGAWPGARMWRSAAASMPRSRTIETE
jgi:hypothetical protein